MIPYESGTLEVSRQVTSGREGGMQRESEFQVFAGPEFRDAIGFVLPPRDIIAGKLINATLNARPVVTQETEPAPFDI